MNCEGIYMVMDNTKLYTILGEEKNDFTMHAFNKYKNVLAMVQSMKPSAWV